MAVEHSILFCVQELARLQREGRLFSLEAFGHIVDILEHLRMFAAGESPEVMNFAASEDETLEYAVKDLRDALGMTEQLQQLRIGSDDLAFPVRGALLTIILQMFANWMSDPDVQQKLLDWIISMFGNRAQE